MSRHLLMCPRPGNARWLAHIVEQVTGLVPEVSRVNDGWQVVHGSNWAGVPAGVVESRNAQAVETYLHITDWPTKQ